MMDRASPEYLAKQEDFQRRCAESNEMLHRQVHVVGPIGWDPKKDGHRFIEAKPHTWPNFDGADGVSKAAMFYVFEKINE